MFFLLDFLLDFLALVVRIGSENWSFYCISSYTQVGGDTMPNNRVFATMFAARVGVIGPGVGCGCMPVSVYL